MESIGELASSVDGDDWAQSIIGGGISSDRDGPPSVSAASSDPTAVVLLMSMRTQDPGSCGLKPTVFGDLIRCI